MYCICVFYTLVRGGGADSLFASTCALVLIRHVNPRGFEKNLRMSIRYVLFMRNAELAVASLSNMRVLVPLVLREQMVSRGRHVIKRAF